MDLQKLSDIIEIEQLLARYAVGMSRHDVDTVIDVFAPGGTYSAFGDVYDTTDFPSLMKAAPAGLYTTGTPALDLDGDQGSGYQTLNFIAQLDHEVRIGYYTDTYTRTPEGWRLQTRAMTFLRRSGARDSGRPHDPTRPKPTTSGH